MQAAYPHKKLRSTTTITGSTAVPSRGIGLRFLCWSNLLLLVLCCLVSVLSAADHTADAKASFYAATGTKLAGQEHIHVAKKATTTTLYVKEGTVLHHKGTISARVVYVAESKAAASQARPQKGITTTAAPLKETNIVAGERLADRSSRPPEERLSPFEGSYPPGNSSHKVQVGAAAPAGSGTTEYKNAIAPAQLLLAYIAELSGEYTLPENAEKTFVFLSRHWLQPLVSSFACRPPPASCRALAA